MCSEGTSKSRDRTVMLQYSTFSHGSEGRPEEMICLKKVKIENGIWLSIDFICWIDCS